MAVRRMHVANSAGRDAVVVGESPQTEVPVAMGVDGQRAVFRRYVAAGAECLNDDLVARFGDDYGPELMQSDPEIDSEVVGRFIEGTQSVLVSLAGEPLFAAPEVAEVIYDPAGQEVSRAAPSDTAATVNDEVPVRWTGRRLPRAEVVRRFVFQRSLQLRHVDGVTFDFLYAMAKELADADEMVLLGAGQSGKEPLVMQMNGSPYRGFLEGRIDSESYLLLLHLSNMELKRPSGWQEQS